MIKVQFRIAVFLIFIALGAGCSSGDGNPAGMNSGDSKSHAGISNPDFQTDEISNRLLHGAWTVDFDLENLSATVNPSRNTHAHYNVSGFLPTPRINVVSYNPTTG
ncbi:MAG: hypothetical protein ABIG42_00300, partial [bacterium]